jgi:hypothetical protein
MQLDIIGRKTNRGNNKLNLAQARRAFKDDMF